MYKGWYWNDYSTWVSGCTEGITTMGCYGDGIMADIAIEHSRPIEIVSFPQKKWWFSTYYIVSYVSLPEGTRFGWYFFNTIGKRTSLLLLDTVGITIMGMTVIYRGLIVIVIVSKVLIYHPNFLGKFTGKLPNSNKHVVGKLIKLGFTNLLG